MLFKEFAKEIQIENNETDKSPSEYRRKLKDKIMLRLNAVLYGAKGEKHYDGYMFLRGDEIDTVTQDNVEDFLKLVDLEIYNETAIIDKHDTNIKYIENRIKEDENCKDRNKVSMYDEEDIEDQEKLKRKELRQNANKRKYNLFEDLSEARYNLFKHLLNMLHGETEIIYARRRYWWNFSLDDRKKLVDYLKDFIDEFDYGYTDILGSFQDTNKRLYESIISPYETALDMYTVELSRIDFINNDVENIVKNKLNECFDILIFIEDMLAENEEKITKEEFLNIKLNN